MNTETNVSPSALSQSPKPGSPRPGADSICPNGAPPGVKPRSRPGCDSISPNDGPHGSSVPPSSGVATHSSWCCGCISPRVGSGSPSAAPERPAISPAAWPPPAVSLGSSSCVRPARAWPACWGNRWLPPPVCQWRGTSCTPPASGPWCWACWSVVYCPDTHCVSLCGCHWKAVATGTLVCLELRILEFSREAELNRSSSRIFLSKIWEASASWSHRFYVPLPSICVPVAYCLKWHQNI